MHESAGEDVNLSLFRKPSFACRSGDCYRCGHDLTTKDLPSDLLQWRCLLFVNRLYGGKCVCAEKEATSGYMFDNNHLSIEAANRLSTFLAQRYVTMEFYFSP